MTISEELALISFSPKEISKGIKRDLTGKFKKGNHSGFLFTPENRKGNQCAKGNKPNKTTFQKGNMEMEKHPCWKGGVQVSKRDGVILNIGNHKRIRRARYVFELEYGEIPKGFVVIHKDGNRDNDNIENLEAISRKENLIRNRK